MAAQLRHLRTAWLIAPRGLAAADDVANLAERAAEIAFHVLAIAAIRVVDAIFPG
jgi:hypothetical protein